MLSDAWPANFWAIPDFEGGHAVRSPSRANARNQSRPPGLAMASRCATFSGGPRTLMELSSRREFGQRPLPSGEREPPVSCAYCVFARNARASLASSGPASASAASSATLA